MRDLCVRLAASHLRFLIHRLRCGDRHANAMHIFKYPLWSRFRTIAWPFFRSEARIKAIGALAVMVILLLAVNGLNFLNSYVMRDFMTALAQREGERFYYFGIALAIVFALASIGEAFSFFLEQQLGLVWREWLTHRLVDRYLASRAYHRQTVNESIDNPDQRISEDTKTFTTSSLSFLVLIVNGLLALAAFLGVLWSITPWLVATAVLYALAGSLGTILLGRQLVPLNNRQLQKEADFRFALVRVRERGAADGRHEGDRGDKSRLLERFQAVVANFRDIIRVTRNVGFFTKEYNYLIQIIPALVVAPLYFQGKVQFGAIAQAAMAFGQVVGAFSLIVTKFQEMSAFAAVVNRLGSMWEATEPSGIPSSQDTEPAPAEIETATDDERIAYEQLTLWTPQEKRVLIRDLTLELMPGQRLLVTGPNGVGKTALCLASAGLWGTGRGKVVRPSMKHITFLPQRLYTATGRLRDLLMYGLDHPKFDDNKLRDALRDVGLDYLAENTDGLDSEWDWPNDLSVGDQHALALARLLLARPRFAVLDGVPWSLSPPRLQRLYEALAQSPITYVSAGGPSDLLPYHDFWLELHGEGEWQLHPTPTPTAVGSNSSG
jgi:putative ATP-binding cassette transporter